MTLKDLGRKMLVGHSLDEKNKTSNRADAALCLAVEEDKTSGLMAIEDELEGIIEQMAQERQKLQRIFDAMPQCIYVSDLITHEIYYANPSLERAFASGSSLEGVSCFEALHGREEPCDFCNNEELMQTGGPLSWEFHNEGLDRDFQIVDSIIEWPGVGQARLEIATDITHQKTIEHELIKQKYKFSALADASYEAIAIHRDNKLITANKAFMELSGYTEEELVAADDLIDMLFDGLSCEIKKRVGREDGSVYKTTIKTKSGEKKEIIVKPNYVEFNHTGMCRVAAIVTHEFIEGRNI